MKKLFLPVLALILPMLIFAGVFQSKVNIPFKLQLASTAYRLAEHIGSYGYEDEWMPQFKVNPFYNSQFPMVPDSMLVAVYDPEYLQWIDYLAVQFTLNNAGFITEFDYMNQYEGFGMKGIAEYDNQNRITKFFLYSMFPDSREDWEPMQRIHIIYTGGTEFEVFGWDRPYDPEYEENPYFRSMFIYDDAGRIVEELSFSSADSLSWYHSYKNTYEYHPQDETNGAVFIDYISRNLALMNLMEDFEFPGKFLNVYYYYWEEGNWTPDYRTIYDYNPQILKSLETYAYYDAMNMEWIPDYRKFFVYDAMENMEYSISQYQWQDQWEDDWRDDYTWETYTSISDPLQSPAISLKLNAYPIPFSDIITIRTNAKLNEEIELGIYNTRGQLIRRFSASGGQDLTWDGRDSKGQRTSSGIYFIRANQGAASGTAKIVKIK